MKKRKEEVPIANFERSYGLMAIIFGITAILDYSSYYLTRSMNPVGIILAVPAVFLSFQCLWLIVNPYAIIYRDKFVIKRSFVSRELMWYFLDIKKVSDSTSRGFSEIGRAHV